jgi:hypothetical protein
MPLPRRNPEEPVLVLPLRGVAAAERVCVRTDHGWLVSRYVVSVEGGMLGPQPVATFSAVISVSGARCRAAELALRLRAELEDVARAIATPGGGRAVPS